MQDDVASSQCSSQHEGATIGSSDLMADKMATKVSGQLPTRAMVRAIQIGTVLLTLGSGLLLNSWILGKTSDLNNLSRSSDAGYWGLMSVAVGAGMMLGVAVTYFYRLIFLIVKRHTE